MNKKIKIIDIFNIISKGDYEALPLNIQVDGNKYNWDNLEYFYGREDREYEDLLELARVYDTVTFLDINVEVLDNNLEDNTEEIEEIPQYRIDNCTDYNYCYLAEKYNQLAKAVNKLRKNKNNE